MRLTIRQILVFVVVLSVVLAFHANRLAKSTKQKQARLELNRGANVACFRTSDSSDPDSYFYAPETNRGIRKWLTHFFGEDYVSDTIFVSLLDGRTSREQFELVKQLRGLRVIFVDESDVELAEWAHQFPKTVILFDWETMVIPNNLHESHIRFWKTNYAEHEGGYDLVFNSDVANK